MSEQQIGGSPQIVFTSGSVDFNAFKAELTQEALSYTQSQISALTLLMQDYVTSSLGVAAAGIANAKAQVTASIGVTEAYADGVGTASNNLMKLYVTSSMSASYAYTDGAITAASGSWFAP